MRLKIVKLSSKSISNFENELSVSFEILPSKLKKFENSLKLPGVLFSISLIIYTKNILKIKVIICIIKQIGSIKRLTIIINAKNMFKSTSLFKRANINPNNSVSINTITVVSIDTIKHLSVLLNIFLL